MPLCWNPARTDARAGTSLPIISGRATSRRHDAPAPQAGPSCLRDVEQGDKHPGSLLWGEANRDSSGVGRREVPGWDLQLCAWGKEKVSAEPQARGFVTLLLEAGNTHKEVLKIEYQHCEMSKYGLHLLIMLAVVSLQHSTLGLH